MTAAAAFPHDLLIEIVDDETPIAVDLAARWPANAPSLADAYRVIFEGARLEAPLASPSAAFMSRLSTESRALLTAKSSLPGVAAWKRAVATAWRLELALALPDESDKHDEAALQELFNDATQARIGLKSIDTAVVSADAVHFIETVLLAAWDRLIRCTAPVVLTPSKGFQSLQSRPRTGTSSRSLQPIGEEPKTPARPKTGQFKALPPQKLLPKVSARTAVMMVVLAALTAGWNLTRSDAADIQSGGAPEGWVLSGDVHSGIATLMPARPDAPVSDLTVETYLADFRARGYSVSTSAPHEFTITSSQLAANH